MKSRILTLLFVLLMFLSAGAVFSQNLAELIPDMASDDLNNRADAQQQWQKICFEAGAPGQEAKRTDVNKQMCEQLEKDLPVVTKVWLLHEMQWTGKADVVPTLAKLLDDPERRIREEAARALAKNPSGEALEALKNTKTVDKTIEDAIASRTVDLTVGVESEFPQNIPYVSDAELKKLLENYAKLSDLEKSRVLVGLTVRKAYDYKPLVLDAIKSDDEFLRKNGILALAQLGTADDVPLMLDLLFGRGERVLMTEIMSNVAADHFDEALVKSLRAEKDADRYLTIASVLARRQIKAIVPDLVAAIKTQDAANRLPLFGVLEQLSDKDNVGDLVDIVLLFPAGGERDDAERVIVRLCKGDAEPVLEKITDANKAGILPLLGRIGGDKAQEIVNAEMKSQNNATRNAAFRALCNWPNAKVADQLLGVVEGTQIPNSMKVPALRAFVRVISLPDGQIGIDISTGDKLEKLKKAMSLATRIEEKRYIIDRASAVRDVETVKYVLGFIDDDNLAQVACRTIEELAHHDYLRRQNKDVFVPALEKVVETTKDNGVRDRAKWYLEH